MRAQRIQRAMPIGGARRGTSRCSKLLARGTSIGHTAFTGARTSSRDLRALPARSFFEGARSSVVDRQLSRGGEGKITSPTDRASSPRLSESPGNYREARSMGGPSTSSSVRTLRAHRSWSRRESASRSHVSDCGASNSRSDVCNQIEVYSLPPCRTPRCSSTTSRARSTSCSQRAN